MNIVSLIAQVIIRDFSPQKVILFGSYAHGEPSDDSDIDLLIIKKTDISPVERWMQVKRLLRDLRLTVPVSPLVYTEEEIRERLDLHDFFIEEILQNGVILYG